MRKRRIVATIECRMTSTRLPGKVMMEAINGKSMLEIMVERVKRVKQINKIVLATTINKTDDCIVTLAKKLKIGYYRGSEDDVLTRVLSAAKKNHADIIVELTGDCPLIDPEIISQVIDCFLCNKCDYVSNSYYPTGISVQVFSLVALKKANHEGLTLQDREHVSLYIVKNPDKFKQITLSPPPKLKRPDIILTLDWPKDYKLIKTVLKKLYPKNKNFSCYDIVELFEKRRNSKR